MENAGSRRTSPFQPDLSDRRRLEGRVPARTVGCRWTPVMASALCALAISTSCGGGGGKRDGGGSIRIAGLHPRLQAPPADPPPPIARYAEGDVELEFLLKNAGGDPVDIQVSFQVEGGTYQAASSAAAGEGIAGLSASREGVRHVFTWDSSRDLGAVRKAVNVRIEAPGATAETGEFLVDNTHPPELEIRELTSDSGTGEEAGSLSGEIQVLFSIRDVEGDPAGIRVRFLEGDRATLATPAPGEGNPRLGLELAPGEPIAGDFTWDSTVDIPAAAEGTLRIEPFDTKVGPAQEVRIGIDNTKPALKVKTPEGKQLLKVEVPFTARGVEPDDLEVTSISYSLTGGGGPFREASGTLENPGGGGGGSRRNSMKESRVFVWNSQFDLDRDLRNGLIEDGAKKRAIISIQIRNRANGAQANGRTKPFGLNHDLLVTMAGGGVEGDIREGPATHLELRFPERVAVDGEGNLYIAETFSHRILEVDGPSGLVDTLAGTGSPGMSADGSLAAASQINLPGGIVLDPQGNILFAESGGNNRVLRVETATGLLAIAAGSGVPGYSGDGGAAASARLTGPEDAAMDASGNLYIADTYNHRIRRVEAASGTITTAAGSGKLGFSGDDGPALQARLNEPMGIAIDAGGNLFIADAGNHRIRKVDGATGIISTIAGNGAAVYSGDGGPAVSAGLNRPTDIVLDSAGALYIADAGNHRIRRVEAGTGIIATVAGNGKAGYSGEGRPATQSSLNFPMGLARDAAGNIYIADTGNGRIRRFRIPRQP